MMLELRVSVLSNDKLAHDILKDIKHAVRQIENTYKMAMTDSKFSISLEQSQMFPIHEEELNNE